ncbi:MAG: hypothetical protein IKW30_09390 [Lachnospiraceae bacterium]|nr:hypothetical protein [Lachnospiraceae bacterium]
MSAGNKRTLIKEIDDIAIEVAEIIKNLNETYGDENYNESVEFKKGIYIFVSFDLVNSTLFKSRHRDKWPHFISSFYETVMDQFAVGRYRESSRNVADDEMQRTGGFHLWKLIGDEVLLYHKIVSKEELYKTILHINDKRRKLIEETIKKYVKMNSEEKENECRHLFQQYFEVKTTVWIASCAGAAEKVSADYPNLVYDSMSFSNENTDLNSQFDFLGPDIDEGFRLCGYSEKKQMIVSPKLVYLLLMSHEKDVDNLNVFNLNFRIVNYVTMKGVWENRLYPIIMFCQCDLNQKTAIEQWKNMFEYDAFATSLLYANIEKYGEKFLQDDKFSISNLKSIYADIVRKEEMDSMLEVFEKQEKSLKCTDVSYVNSLWKRKPKFEFHISCLCYDKDKQKYWVTNHPTHGWSFGCTQVIQNTDYYDYVMQVYLKKYGLDIKINSSNEILSFYSVDRKSASEVILGVVILVTEVKEYKTMDGLETKWVSFEEGEHLQGNKLTNFVEILKKAQNWIS